MTEQAFAAARQPPPTSAELLTEAARRAAELGWRTITVRRLTRLRAGDATALPPAPPRGRVVTAVRPLAESTISTSRKTALTMTVPTPGAQVRILVEGEADDVTVRPKGAPQRGAGCSAALMPLHDGPTDRCTVDGPHTVHRTAAGTNFRTPDTETEGEAP